MSSNDWCLLMSHRRGLANRDVLRSTLHTLVGRLVPAVLFSLLALVKVSRLQATLTHGAGGEQLADLVSYLASAAHEGLAALFVGSMAVLFVVRKHSIRRLTRPVPQIMAVLGTWILFFLPLRAVTQTHWSVHVLASLLLAAGMACAVLSLLTLGRCFGVLPEARGLVTRGPYRYVRHPLYTSEALSSLGLLLPVVSPLTVAVYCLFLVLQALRTRYEEEVLSAAFPEYAAYQRTTRRFIPGVF